VPVIVAIPQTAALFDGTLSDWPTAGQSAL